MSNSATPPEELGFAASLAELQSIVSDLESSQLDIDVLTAKVERAAELVSWCRDRIAGTRLRVDEILVTFDDAAED
ncbi:MAG: exodeoxyribonuclease VII small subunit [Actinomycetes bacterium]